MDYSPEQKELAEAVGEKLVLFVNIRVGRRRQARKRDREKKKLSRCQEQFDLVHIFRRLGFRFVIGFLVRASRENPEQIR